MTIEELKIVADVILRSRVCQENFLDPLAGVIQELDKRGVEVTRQATTGELAAKNFVYDTEYFCGSSDKPATTTICFNPVDPKCGKFKVKLQGANTGSVELIQRYIAQLIDAAIAGNLTQ